MANLTGSTTAVFFVRLSTAVDEIVDVDWNTRDGTAIAGQDYEAASGTVSFLPGETEKAIDVVVYGQDDVLANGKKFYIELKPPANAVLTDALAECVITVADEDGVLFTSLVIAQGKRGFKGNPGLSAYEQAVLMGYEGTVEQWMEKEANAARAAERAEAAAVAANIASKVFASPESGVNPNTGVPVGDYFNVRSPLSTHYVDEYQNIGGAAIPTGKSYPSATGLENAIAATEANAIAAEMAATAANIAGKVYSTPESGVDPVTGVADGDYFNVRSSSDASYVDEYRNVNGVAVATGKSYLSALGVQLQEKAASTIKDASGKTQQDINEGLNSISDLLSIENLHNWLRIYVKNYHDDGFGIGGDFVYSAGLSKSLHDGGYFIDPSKTFPADWANRTQQNNWFNAKNTGTGVFVRVQTGVFNVEQWGVRGDGIAEEDIALNAIVQSIPEGATLHMLNKTCTILVDAPAGGTFANPPAAWKINRRITVQGTIGCTVKMKDFCSAWVDYVTVIDTVQVTASGAKVFGLRVDANADNHYQIAVDGHKWWEAAPAPLVAKRPPHGIIVRCFADQPNTKDVELAYNFVLRPVTGVGAIGSGVGIENQDFYDKKLAVGCVENARIYGNYTYRCRGNDVLFISGVINSEAYDNKSENSYYHTARMYSGCVGCEMRNNNAVYNYKALEALYNSTDNGYYRTTNTADVQYKIQRSGVRMGSGYSDPVGTGGNIRDCKIHGGTLTYVGGLSPIINETSTQAASTSLLNVATDCEIYNVTSYDSPFYAAVTINTPDASTSSVENCSIHDNTYIRASQPVVLQSDNASFYNNKLIDCHSDPSTLLSVIRARQANPYIVGNKIEYSVAQSNARSVVEFETAIKGVIHNNTVKNIRPVSIVTAANSEVFGSNAIGKKIPIVAAYTQVARTNVNLVSDNMLNISGVISATNAVITIAALDLKFRPLVEEYFDFVVTVAGTQTAVGDRFVGKLTVFGQIQIELGGKTNIGTVAFSKTYQSNFFQLA